MLQSLHFLLFQLSLICSRPQIPNLLILNQCKTLSPGCFDGRLVSPPIHSLFSVVSDLLKMRLAITFLCTKFFSRFSFFHLLHKTSHVLHNLASSSHPIILAASRQLSSSSESQALPPAPAHICPQGSALYGLAF